MTPADYFDLLAEKNRENLEDPDHEVTNADFVRGAATAYEDAARFLRGGDGLDLGDRIDFAWREAVAGVEPGEA